MPTPRTHLSHIVEILNGEIAPVTISRNIDAMVYIRSLMPGLTLKESKNLLDTIKYLNTPLHTAPLLKG